MCIKIKEKFNLKFTTILCISLSLYFSGNVISTSFWNNSFNCNDLALMKPVVNASYTRAKQLKHTLETYLAASFEILTIIRKFRKTMYMHIKIQTMYMHIIYF